MFYVVEHAPQTALWGLEEPPASVDEAVERYLNDTPPWNWPEKINIIGYNLINQANLTVVDTVEWFFEHEWTLEGSYQLAIERLQDVKVERLKALLAVGSQTEESNV